MPRKYRTAIALDLLAWLVSIPLPTNTAEVFLSRCRAAWERTDSSPWKIKKGRDSLIAQSKYLVGGDARDNLDGFTVLNSVAHSLGLGAADMALAIEGTLTAGYPRLALDAADLMSEDGIYMWSDSTVDEIVEWRAMYIRLAYEAAAVLDDTQKMEQLSRRFRREVGGSLTS